MRPLNRLDVVGTAAVPLVVWSLDSHQSQHRAIRAISGDWRGLQGSPGNPWAVAAYLREVISYQFREIFRKSQHQLQACHRVGRYAPGQCIAPVSINPLNLADQAAAMPLVAGQCTIAASSPKSSDWIDDAPAQRWPAISAQHLRRSGTAVPPGESIERAP